MLSIKGTLTFVQGRKPSLGSPGRVWDHHSYRPAPWLAFPRCVPACRSFKFVVSPGSSSTAIESGPFHCAHNLRTPMPGRQTVARINAKLPMYSLTHPKTTGFCSAQPLSPPARRCMTPLARMFQIISSMQPDKQPGNQAPDQPPWVPSWHPSHSSHATKRRLEASVTPDATGLPVHPLTHPPLTHLRVDCGRVQHGADRPSDYNRYWNRLGVPGMHVAMRNWLFAHTFLGNRRNELGSQRQL